MSRPAADAAPAGERTSSVQPRAKIVCTLGPASATDDVVAGLVDAGMDVARINFSHGTHTEQAATIGRVRSAAAARGRPIAILGDLQGPRIRIGELAAPIMLATGQDLVLVPEASAGPGEVPITYEALAADVHPGDRILINDGLLEVMVLEVAPPRVVTRVVHGGPLLSHKGLNLPGIRVSAPAITDKDAADIAFAITHELDYLALSFVRRAADLAELRTRLPSDLLIIAKIEKDAALKHIEEILRASDGVMVARGDLGVELPFEEVPIAQKRIIRLANQLGRPVITATQMLESMVDHPRPTRAEASDVANAILDGTDAVMLSAETAIGAYPIETVEVMARIAVQAESACQPPAHGARRGDKAQAVASAANTLAHEAGARLIVVFTRTGISGQL